MAYKNWRDRDELGGAVQLDPAGEAPERLGLEQGGGNHARRGQGAQVPGQRQRVSPVRLAR